MPLVVALRKAAETFLNPQPYFYGGAARFANFWFKNTNTLWYLPLFIIKQELFSFLASQKPPGERDWKVSGILPSEPVLVIK